MKKKILASIVFLAIVPSMALAQVDTSYIDSLILSVKGILNALVPIVIALAVLYFMWGVLQFISSGDDEEKRKAGRSRMFNGIIAIFVMVSIWGLVAFVGNIFNIGSGPVVMPDPVP